VARHRPAVRELDAPGLRDAVRPGAGGRRPARSPPDRAPRGDATRPRPCPRPRAGGRRLRRGARLLRGHQLVALHRCPAVCPHRVARRPERRRGRRGGARGGAAGAATRGSARGTILRCRRSSDGAGVRGGATRLLPARLLQRSDRGVPLVSHVSAAHGALSRAAGAARATARGAALAPGAPAPALLRRLRAGDRPARDVVAPPQAIRRRGDAGQHGALRARERRARAASRRPSRTRLLGRRAGPRMAGAGARDGGSDRALLAARPRPRHATRRGTSRPCHRPRSRAPDSRWSRAARRRRPRRARPPGHRAGPCGRG
jgi:hypothetical protein